MRRKCIFLLAVFGTIGLVPYFATASSRIKDIASFEGVRDNQLVGYGLVVGLNGTGDRSNTFFTTQTLANMLQRSGIVISPDQVRVKNIAAVMVTATLPPSIRQGNRVDCVVSSIGDAQSVQGGVLIQTPLYAANNQVSAYVVAQGQVTIGGFSAGSNGASVQQNHPTVGRIPNGGLVEKDMETDFAGKNLLNLVLIRNDFTTVNRAAHAINQTVNGNSDANVAIAKDGRTIAINVPSNYGNRIIEFMSMIENVQVEVDLPARVVINEKTGTIVLGKDVRIAEVSIIHGSLSLQVGTTLNVSQPPPLSKSGQTVVVPETTISLKEQKGRTATLREGANVEEIVRALTSIGAGPRDVIAILQAIKAQGALQADLEII
jgi:flagellar P-ring protein FlgI